MNRWLLKTEPGEYSFEDLIEDGTAAWDGVKGPAALKNMRTMKKGDKVLIYHTGREKSVVGTGSVAGEAYPDPEKGDGRLLVVDIAAGAALSRPVTLAEIKESNLFPGWDLVRLPRLSVMPVSKAQWDKIVEWGGLEE